MTVKCSDDAVQTGYSTLRVRRNGRALQPMTTRPRIRSATVDGSRIGATVKGSRPKTMGVGGPGEYDKVMENGLDLPSRIEASARAAAYAASYDG